MIPRTVFLVTLLASTGAGTAFGQDDQRSIPRGIRERVVSEVAVRWSTATQDIAVDWRGVAAPDSIAPADAIQLRGNGLQGWFLVVVDPAGRQSFSMRVRAGRITPVPVATRRLRRDDVLEPEDIAYVTDTIWAPPPLEGDLFAQPGWRVRWNVRMGAPLIAPIVLPPVLIELAIARGDEAA